MSIVWETVFTELSAVNACEDLVKNWRLTDKKVFVLRAGEKISSVKSLYERLLPFLGTPAAFAEDVKVGDRENQRTGEIWMEVRYDPRFPNAYRHSANAQPLHTDGSYIPNYTNSTLLACVANAGEGGETTFLDSRDLVACMEVENPSLLKQLLSIPMPHARSGDSRTECVITRASKDFHVNWNYYCVSPTVDSKTKEIAEQFHNYLLESPMVKAKTVPIKLQPGDAVMWKDDQLLHGRNSFAATKESERFIWKCALDVGVFNGNRQ